MLVLQYQSVNHTAVETPERCVFGQMVNIGAVMLGMNVILRYLFCKNYLQIKSTPPGDKWYKINLAGLVLGILSAFGLSMVANFQTEAQRVPHYIGAGLAFGLGTVYCWFQTALTYQVRYRFNKKKFVLLFIQFINSLTMSMLLVLFSTTKAIYKVQKRQGKGTKLKKHSSVNLQKMADNNSNIPRSDVKNMTEGRVDEDNHVTKGPSAVSNGTT